MLFGLVWFLAALFKVLVLSRLGWWGFGRGMGVRLKLEIQLNSAWTKLVGTSLHFFFGGEGGGQRNVLLHIISSWVNFSYHLKTVVS